MSVRAFANLKICHIKKHLYTICSFHISSIAKFLNVGSCKSLSDSIHLLLKALINSSKKIFSVIVITSELRQTQNNNCFPFTYNCSFSFLLLCSPSEKRCYALLSARLGTCLIKLEQCHEPETRKTIDWQHGHPRVGPPWLSGFEQNDFR